MLKKIEYILAVILVILGAFLIIYGALANIPSGVMLGFLLIVIVANELTRFKN